LYPTDIILYNMAATKPEVVKSSGPVTNRILIPGAKFFEVAEFKAITYNSDRHRSKTETKWHLAKKILPVLAAAILYLII